MKQFITLCTFILVCFSISTAQWTNGQNALYVVGQANFTSSASGSGMANLNSPQNVAIDFINKVQSSF
ncbi:MAG: hypothetical protein WBW71_05255 [Bacteroidota bacterium]